MDSESLLRLREAAIAYADACAWQNDADIAVRHARTDFEELRESIRQDKARKRVARADRELQQAARAFRDV